MLDLNKKQLESIVGGYFCECGGTYEGKEFLISDTSQCISVCCFESHDTYKTYNAGMKKSAPLIWCGRFSDPNTMRHGFCGNFY